MMCDWDSLLAVLPPKLKSSLQGNRRKGLQELRLRLGNKPEFNYGNDLEYDDHIVTREDIHYIVNAASRYSPWQAETISKGYLSVRGGHRIGLCGEVICSGSVVKGIRDPDSLCIRIAWDVPGIGKPYMTLKGSVLILGAPGWGKTTLLRDLSRQIAQTENTVVLDERGELFPEGCTRGKRMDVLRMCPKPEGIELAIRTLGPQTIALDEITGEEDSKTILHGANCGVRFLATAHGASREDLHNRRSYRILVDEGIFQNILLLHKDKTCTWERVGTCS